MILFRISSDMSFSRNFSIFSISRFGSCMWNSHTKQIMLGLPWGWCSIWTGFGEKWVKGSIQTHFKNISQVTPTARHCTVPDTVATQRWGLSLPSRAYLEGKELNTNTNNCTAGWESTCCLCTDRVPGDLVGRSNSISCGRTRKAVWRRNNVGGEA